MANTSPNITADQYTEILIAELIKTEDFKRVTGSFIHELLNKWAGESSIKKKMTPPIEKRVKKLLFDGDDSNGASGYVPGQDNTVLSDPIIALTNDMLSKVNQMGSTLEELPYEKKEDLVKKVITNVNFSSLSALSGPIARMLNEIHENNPTFFSEAIKSSLTAWVDELDFVTIKDHLVKSQEDFLAISKTINDALWKSPDRLLEVLEILPAGINLLNKTLGDMLVRFSSLKIDDLTDIFLHLFEKIDGEALGTLLNANAHINRKIMRGTEELRDPETDIPSTENIIMTKIEEIASKMDPNLIFNMRLNIEDLKVPLREWLMSD